MAMTPEQQAFLDGVETGRAEECAAVVADLRGIAGECDVEWGDPRIPRFSGHRPSGVCRALADRYERGEHDKKGGE